MIRQKKKLRLQYTVVAAEKLIRIDGLRAEKSLLASLMVHTTKISQCAAKQWKSCFFIFCLLA
jgi:hypothetical protein